MLPSAWSFWFEVSHFPTHLNDDLYSGLPNGRGTFEFIFHDFGRPSYIYNIMMSVLLAIPGVQAAHLYLLFLGLLVGFGYLMFRALGLVSSPFVALGLLTIGLPHGHKIPGVQLARMWHETLDVFISCRSWGTELFAIGAALVLMSPSVVKQSTWALPAALLCLGLACGDNPFHVVHLTGFGLGLLLYFRAQNQSEGIGNGLLRWQWTVVALGVLACASIFGAAMYALGVDEPGTGVLWSTWLREIGYLKVLPYYMAPLVLAWWRPPREWYPLIGTAVLSSAVILFLPLVVTHRTMGDILRYLRPTFPIILVADLGLVWLYAERLGSMLNADFRRRLLFRFGPTIVMTGVGLALFAEGLPGTLEFKRQALAGRVISIESGLKVYHRFATKPENTTPVYLLAEDHFVFTSWASTAYPRTFGRLSVDGVAPDDWDKAFSAGSWQREPFDCSRPEEAFLVSSLREDEAGQPVQECKRCVPEELLLPAVSNRERILRVQSEIFGHFMEANYSSPYFPYIVWRCAAVVGNSEDEAGSGGN